MYNLLGESINPSKRELRKKQRNNVFKVGYGEQCPKCKDLMERRKHKERPKKTWFYTEWDYCPKCQHVQHYEKFKSAAWQEHEQQQDFFNNI